MPIHNIEELDQGTWGVCGFVAAIQAAQANGLQNYLPATSREILLPVIEGFCGANRDLDRSLLEFSRAFGEEYDYDNVDQILQGMQDDPDMEEGGLGLAMTAQAVSRLCRSLGFQQANFQGTTASSTPNRFTYSNAIYGLGRQREQGSTRLGFRFGLQHWIYVDAGGHVMSWGHIEHRDQLDQHDVLSRLLDYRITQVIPGLQ